jgi:hypothetical protein
LSLLLYAHTTAAISATTMISRKQKNCNMWIKQPSYNNISIHAKQSSTPPTHPNSTHDYSTADTSPQHYLLQSDAMQLGVGHLLLSGSWRTSKSRRKDPPPTQRGKGTVYASLCLPIC